MDGWINKVHQGDCIDLIKRLPDGSIDSVITSPPYWMQREYGWDGQWGLEETYQLYLEHLWGLMDEIYRVLKPNGTVWINLGDTYNTVSGGMTQNIPSTSRNQNMERSLIGKSKYKKSKEIPSKCLLLLPHRFAIGATERRWILRNDITWARKNALPESVIDRFARKRIFSFLSKIKNTILIWIVLEINLVIFQKLAWVKILATCQISGTYLTKQIP